MKVRYGEEVANRFGPESCGDAREGVAEALIGETDRPGIEPRNQEFGMPTLLCEAEGNTELGVNRKSCNDPARSKTLSMSGSLLHGSWEVSSARALKSVGGAGKAYGRNPVANAGEKSDAPILPRKPPIEGVYPEEAVEGRGAAKGNADEISAPRTQSRTSRASMGLEGVRETARLDRRLRFTALLHHITPSRRVYIPKADGRQRPLGIASLEDKIVQQAVATVLSAIYEEDFLGFSYGFRPRRSPHQALDALSVGIQRKRVNWILDADIRGFFDEIDHGWMLRFLEHRIADRRILSLVRKWLKAGVIEDGRRVAAERGTPQGAV